MLLMMLLLMMIFKMKSRRILYAMSNEFETFFHQEVKLDFTELPTNPSVSNSFDIA
jgi:hypothetical protein